MKKTVFLILLVCISITSALAREYEYANIPYGSSVEDVRSVFISYGYEDKGYVSGANAYMYLATIYDEVAIISCTFDETGLCAILIEFPFATTSSPVYYAILNMMLSKYGKPTDETKSFALWNGDTSMAGIRLFDDSSFDVEYYKTAYAKSKLDSQSQDLKGF